MGRWQEGKKFRARKQAGRREGKGVKAGRRTGGQALLTDSPWAVGLAVEKNIGSTKEYCSILFSYYKPYCL